ncbi:MAG: hypothetical protein ACTSWN_15950 [Promethearchaeota archaeon]
MNENKKKQEKPLKKELKPPHSAPPAGSATTRLNSTKASYTTICQPRTKMPRSSKIK